jgi:hypothetical protein
VKKISLLVLLLVFVLFGSVHKKQNQFFNGKDLSGWKIHGTEKWYVEKGELICESGPDKQYGYLSTEKNYKNFELTLKFKQKRNAIAVSFTVRVLKA